MKALAECGGASSLERIGGAIAGAVNRIEGSDDMAKGQAKSNKETRKPKAEKKKTIAANPSTKGTVRNDDD